MPILLVDELRPVDKMCERWAAERRDSLPTVKCTLHNMALVKQGVVLEGPHEMSDDSLVIDQIFLTSPEPTKAFLVIWYAQNTPVPVKAKNLGISKALIYTHWKQVLSYVLGRLHGFGLQV